MSLTDLAYELCSAAMDEGTTAMVLMIGSGGELQVLGPNLEPDELRELFLQAVDAYAAQYQSHSVN